MLRCLILSCVLLCAGCPEPRVIRQCEQVDANQAKASHALCMLDRGVVSADAFNAWSKACQTVAIESSCVHWQYSVSPFVPSRYPCYQAEGEEKELCDRVKKEYAQ